MLKNSTVYENYACDLCGSDMPIEIPHSRLYTNNQPIHICGNCGFVYVRARRSSEEIARVWSEEIYGEKYTAVKNPAIIARQTFVAEFLASKINITRLKVCDIGAGEGFFLGYLRDQYHVYPFGIEPSSVNCSRLIKMNINNYQGTVEQFVNSSDGRNFSADIVSIMWTLENCHSCIEMLKAASLMLPIGGKVIVATGSRILVPFKKPLFAYLSTNPADSHSFRFSANALQTALAKVQFRTIAINSYLDNDILCILAEKVPETKTLSTKKDIPIEVLSFFERWHQDSLHYLKDWVW